MLVHRYQDRVRALAYRLTGRWADADDVAQETFLRVYRSAGSYQPTAALWTWLYRIVVNLCLDRAKRPRLAPLEHDGVGETQGPADHLQRLEVQAAVRWQVQGLPKRQRVALVLHRFEGLGHREIAQAINCSESAVESLLVRAYATLREGLRDV